MMPRGVEQGFREDVQANRDFTSHSEGHVMKRFPFPLAFTAALAVATTLPAEENSATSTEAFVHFGQMHEAIGQQQHQGRVVLSELLTKPHFYGVGAAEGLTGEITIDNGVAVVTAVDPTP